MKPAPATTSSRRARRSCSGRWLTSRPPRTHVEGDEHWRRGDYGVVGIAQPLEPRPQLLIEHRQLAVEDERGRPELRDRGRDVRVAADVVDAVPAHKSDAGTVLVGRHAVAVDLLLADPTGAVKGRADERWGHRSVRADHRRQFTALTEQWTPASSLALLRARARHRFDRPRARLVRGPPSAMVLVWRPPRPTVLREGGQCVRASESHFLDGDAGRCPVEL